MDSAPSTPSQDAEGDGHWRVIARVVGTGGWRSYERTNADGRVESHRLDESLALAIESAIRAPYEALEKAARMALECADSPEERVSPKRIDEMTPDEVAIAYCASEAWGRVNAIRDWLRIPLAALESLGGRS